MMDFQEKKLYHQIHPLKLATDIGVTPIFFASLASCDCGSPDSRFRPACSRVRGDDDLAS